MAKSCTKEIAREKTPQERVKDSYSYEKACNAAKNSGTPTYHFAVGDRVQVGHLPNCVVEEVRKLSNEVKEFLAENCADYSKYWSDIPMKAVARIESGRKVLWKNPIFEETKK